MIRVISILVLMLALSISSYSQNKYPYMSVIDKDTVVLVALDQVKLINSRMESLKLKTIECDELYRLVSLHSESNESLKRQLSLKDDVITNMDYQIDNLNRTLDLSIKENKKTKRKYLLIAGIGVSLGVGGLITAIIAK